jgi:hypothetical protein
MITQIQKDITMNNKSEVKERLVASRDKAKEVYEKSMSEFRSYISIWEALEAIRENSLIDQLNEAIHNLECGRTAESILEHVDAAIVSAKKLKVQRTEMKFPSADMLEDDYVLQGIMRAKVRIRRALYPDMQLVPVIKRIKYDDTYEVPPNETRVIHGIEFTHEYDKDDDPASNIYVVKGEFSASLTCAYDTGEWSGRDDPVQIPASDLRIIEKVYDWWVDSEY